MLSLPHFILPLSFLPLLSSFPHPLPPAYIYRIYTTSAGVYETYTPLCEMSGFLYRFCMKLRLSLPDYGASLGKCPKRFRLWNYAVAKKSVEPQLLPIFTYKRHHVPSQLKHWSGYTPVSEFFPIILYLSLCTAVSNLSLAYSANLYVSSSGLGLFHHIWWPWRLFPALKLSPTLPLLML